MTTVEAVGIPTRYRAAEKRGLRLGRPLRLAARIAEVDEGLLEQLGHGFMEVDDLGGRLAKAMRLPAGDPNRVTMADFRTALDEGIDAVVDAPPALREFFDV